MERVDYQKFVKEVACELFQIYIGRSALPQDSGVMAKV